MPKLTVGPKPTRDALRFARSEEFLTSIDSDGRRVGAVVFGSRRLPYKVNFQGAARGSFATWAEAVECVSGLQLAPAD